MAAATEDTRTLNATFISRFRRNCRTLLCFITRERICVCVGANRKAKTILAVNTYASTHTCYAYTIGWQ